MTVSELINLLWTINPDYEVTTETEFFYEYDSQPSEILASPSKVIVEADNEVIVIK